ncbi:DUF4232 domain-containing protein [Microbacterium sp. W4I20]|uniref:DUF4232 domain-containing protein n=1 Tax=Microbacterium sp. W4I20 TaxID=3042262 RepID=UPI0027858C16|nr:DUF4232 domain-containing protein [Microbacterium sp. W4I20]MDQ0726140.1 hypothetical protein [Microbacterium sp. W4I20]
MRHGVMRGAVRHGLIGGGVLAVLWFVSGWLAYLLSGAGGSLATLASLIPTPLGRGVFGSPVLWAVLVQLLMAAVLVAGFAALAVRLSAGRLVFATAWLAAILTSFAVGAALDLGNFIVGTADFGIRGAIGTMGATSETTWWAVVVGWIPALVTVRSGRMRDEDPSPAPGPTTRSSLTVVALVAAVALVLLPFAAQAGADAMQQQLREEQAAAQAEADPSGAVAPDPSASGDPVPTAGPSEGASDDGACTAANTTIMTSPPDGATGHRGQLLQLVNVADEPCTVDGYPDVAYGDQNGHLLDVAVEHGRSFMAEDPGASPIVLPPGGSASAFIGWDANSVQGQLAARSIWVAVLPGEERLSWDMPLDIIPGATVYVTAWQATVVPEG